MTDLEDLRTIEHAARELGVAASTLRRQAEGGRFRAVRVGQCWVTTDAAIAEYRAASLGKPGRRPTAR